jgi:hypothetical protein
LHKFGPAARCHFIRHQIVVALGRIRKISLQDYTKSRQIECDL